jgi:hypothetical protein
MSEKNLIEDNAEECCNAYESCLPENTDSWIGWVESWYYQQDKIDAKAKEVERLQKGITYLIENCGDIPEHMIIEAGLEDFTNE